MSQLTDDATYQQLLADFEAIRDDKTRGAKSPDGCAAGSALMEYAEEFDLGESQG